MSQHRLSCQPARRNFGRQAKDSAGLIKCQPAFFFLFFFSHNNNNKLVYYLLSFSCMSFLSLYTT